MKKVISVLFSPRLMVIIVLMFALSIAVATFIENDFGSQTAHAAIYNAWWFNLLLFVGIINLTGTIITGKLYRKEKFSIFLFHLAFLFILTGAAITRYTGFEGLMHIRSGESSQQVFSSNNYLRLTTSVEGKTYGAEKQIDISALSRNYHKLNLNAPGRKISAECLQIIPNAVETLVNDPAGEPMIEMVISGQEGKQTIILSPGQVRKTGQLVFTMNDSSNINGVNIDTRGESPVIRTGTEAKVMNMMTRDSAFLNTHINYPLQMRSLYQIAGSLVVFRTYNPTARREITSSGAADPKKTNLYALQLKLNSGAVSKTISYLATNNTLNDPVTVNLGTVTAKISFGARVIQLPFAIKLKQFILERYPGSNSPSWFESKIVLLDPKAGESAERRIYMNNILKHRGYRFYQSSYDEDEQGTIFSVNHDYPGTVVTYLGYLMLAFGIVFSILNKNSRFRKLSIELSAIRASGNKVVPIMVLAGITFFSFKANAQDILPDSVAIDKQQAAKFGELLIQDPGGRIKPINTLSSELLRKVSRKTRIMDQTADQVFLGMLTFPSYWQNVPMIRVSHPEIQKILHIQRPYVSFAEAFNEQSERQPYILGTYVQEAFQKKPAERSTFDTEIIRLDERINLSYQVYIGSLLRIFPRPDDATGTWYSPVNLSGVFSEKDSFFVHSIVPVYLQSLLHNPVSKTIISTDDAWRAIHNYQTITGKNIVPSSFKVKLEILYNRANLFERLGSIYGGVGFVLLIFLFVSVFLPRLNLKPVFRVSSILLYVCFGFHLAGLIARGYISGHAPWSNAYESLVYIAFATVLSGLIFSRKSSVTLPVAALIAWLILFVAHLNWMDPQIAYLVPVLKSYWLLIHVAIITASYGFLALGALMAFINLVLMISQTKSNMPATERMITEFSLVIEMTLIIGLYMLTIGTFLGGVWANESWGRYWGWDPKETWALVSILVYAFVAHMRLVPGLKGNYIFNLMSLLGFSSIMMTYFGVNYYLSGMHSYAKGDPLPVPAFVYYTLAVVGLVALLAWENQRRMKKHQLNKE